MASYKRNEAHEKWMRQRLAAAVTTLAGGNAEEMGRQLGYQNGGYVREVLAGRKPVGKAIVERMTTVPGAQGWFADAPHAPSARSSKSRQLSARSMSIAKRLEALSNPSAQAAAYERLSNILTIYEAEQREAAHLAEPRA